MESRTQSRNKTERYEIRWSAEELAVAKRHADMAGLSLSEFVRRVATRQPLVAKSDQETIAELRKLGGLIKHLFGERATGLTPAEKRQAWAVVEALDAAAKALAGRKP